MKRLHSIPAIGLVLAFLLASKITSAQSFFTTEVIGKGKPMLLIHGLYCSGDVWKETVNHYKNNYECHVLTLAGFNGNTPNLNDHFLASVKDDIVAYVKDKKLKKPVILGHSMGAFLALWASSSAPDLFGKVIAVDGAPCLAALMMPNGTPETAKPMALQMKNGIAGQTPEQVRQYQSTMLKTMISRQENIDQVVEIAVKADSKTQGEVMYEMMTTDIRPDMAMINCPVLVLGAWIGYKNYGATHDSVQKNYADQMAAAKKVTVEVCDTANHFIFFDDPAWFFEKVDAFLTKS